MKVNLIFGNHSETPTFLEDLFNYIYYGLKNVGVNTLFSFNTFYGDGINFVLENYDDKNWYNSIIDLRKKYNNSRLVFIMSELIRNNRFDTADLTNTLPSTDNYSHYYNKDYWQKRYDGYEKILPFTDAIISLTYKNAEGGCNIQNKKIFNLPSVYMKKLDKIEERPFEEKNIDFLFTGSITPHRQNIINSLKQYGYNVLVCFGISLPNYIRDDYSSRSKIHLGMQLSSTSHNLSTFRAWYCLNNNLEHLFEILKLPDDPDYISNYINFSDPNTTFVESCIEHLKKVNSGQKYSNKNFINAELDEKKVFSSLKFFLESLYE